MSRSVSVKPTLKEYTTIILAGLTERWYFSHLQSFYNLKIKEAVLISFDKFVKHDLDECNLYHSFCGFSKEFIIDGQPSEVFQP